MRSELPNRMRNIGSNALASSIVLVCRPRPDDAPLATQREFLAALKHELPHRITVLQHEGIAAVDLAQASIGPGMAIFSRYSRVLGADGNPMSVRASLGHINAELDRFLAEQEGELDPDTRFCVAFFDDFGHRPVEYGQAEVLSKAKNVGIEALVRAGMVEAGKGKVRLLTREELDPRWDPLAGRRVAVWECAQHLIRALRTGGEEEAARLAQRMGPDLARWAVELAHRLYAIAERRKRSEEQQAYNELAASWSAIQEKMARADSASVQRPLI